MLQIISRTGDPILEPLKRAARCEAKKKKNKSSLTQLNFPNRPQMDPICTFPHRTALHGINQMNAFLNNVTRPVPASRRQLFTVPTVRHSNALH